MGDVLSSDGQATTGGVLRLLGAGASGPILMALGREPLRTMELTERVAGYSPRTVYRYATRLTQLGLIDRHEEEGVPSKVVHSLSERGRELYDLVAVYAAVGMKRLRGGEIGGAEWAGLALVGELWELGMIDQLNRGPKSLTELSDGEHGLSFHQVSRRAGLFARSGFIREIPGAGRYRRYALTDKTRMAMGLIAGIGRWRRRHVVPSGSPGLSVGEAAGLMRTALPLVFLPGHAGKSFELGIASPQEADGSAEPVWGGVVADGSVVNHPAPPENVDGAAHGNVPAWVDSVLDGPRNGLRVKGDAELIADCLGALHASLWRNGNGSAAAAAEAVAGRSDGA
ncbi:MAG TPA: winged helix-turn-helix transcriptional regulator [Solirubrobacterales bacterium]|nr:winged helix-turn-helix transcriptional regulator [Solirubrobacterales bacterium]